MSARQTPHASDDRLIDLAVGLLPAQEATASLAHLGTCAACEQRFREIAGERARIEAEREPAVAGPRWTWVAGAASVAAVLLIGLLSISREPTRSGPPAYWLPTDREATVLRADVEPESTAEQARALSVYRSRDAARAATMLREARVSESHERLRDLYLASALELSGEPARAAEVLERLDETGLPEPWRSQARWVEYRVACAIGDAVRAERKLQELRSASGEIGRLARLEVERRAGGR